VNIIEAAVFLGKKNLILMTDASGKKDVL